MIEAMRTSPDVRQGVETIPPGGKKRELRGRRVPVRTTPRSVLPWSATGAGTDLPAWVDQFLDCPDLDSRFGHRMVRVEDAASMDAARFEVATRDAYRQLLDGLTQDQLLRAWNFIPGINDPADQATAEVQGNRDRYMVFNAGRYHGFTDSMGSPVIYPAASGVGHAGEDLVVHLLHGPGHPRSIDNPRQVMPDAYSSRFGDPPPVFARAATVQVGGREGLLVSGTASVVGEDSAHLDAFDGQLFETLRNLAVVVDAAWPGVRPEDLDDWLVYLPDLEYEEQVLAAIGAGPRVIVRQQGLCRPELLVEIECAGFRALNGSDA